MDRSDPSPQMPFEGFFREKLPSVDMTRPINGQITQKTWFQGASGRSGCAWCGNYRGAGRGVAVSDIEVAVGARLTVPARTNPRCSNEFLQSA